MNSKHSKPTQCERIKKYLADFGKITQMDALRDLGIMRLASRMSELKSNGFEFKKRNISTKNRYGEKVSFAEYYI